MNRTGLIAATVVICAGIVCAQSTTPQTPPAGSQGESAAGATKSTQKQPGMRSGQGMAGMHAMHEQHMQDIQASLARMHALLNSMRASYGSMSPKDQPAMQANVELWQMLLNHLDQMAQHMQGMHDGGMDHHEGTHHMGGMGPTNEGTPKQGQGVPQQAPPPQ